jgi:anti-anti-sigma factor
MTEVNIAIDNIEALKEGRISKMIKIVGELDETNVDEEMQKIYGIIGENPWNLDLIFDFSGLGYLNSKCIGYLTDIYGKLSESNGKIAIFAARPNVLDTLQVVGLTQLITMYDTFEQAKAGVIQELSGPQVQNTVTPTPETQPVQSVAATSSETQPVQSVPVSTEPQSVTTQKTTNPEASPNSSTPTPTQPVQAQPIATNTQVESIPATPITTNTQVQPQSAINPIQTPAPIQTPSAPINEAQPTQNAPAPINSSEPAQNVAVQTNTVETIQIPQSPTQETPPKTEPTMNIPETPITQTTPETTQQNTMPLPTTPTENTTTTNNTQANDYKFEA